MTIYEFTDELKKNAKKKSLKGYQGRMNNLEKSKITLIEPEIDSEYEDFNSYEEKFPIENSEFSVWKAALFLLSSGLAFLGMFLSFSGIVICATAACIMLCQNHFFNNLVWTSWEFLKFFSVLTLSLLIAIFSPNLGFGLLGLKIADLHEEYMHHMLASFLLKVRG